MKTKIFRDRDLIGRFTCDGKVSRVERFKSYMSRTIKNVLILLALFLAGSYGILGINSYLDKDTQIVFAQDRSMEIFQTKIEQLKDDVVSDLMKCESAGHKESDGLIIMDTNNKLSYGRAQWQMTSLKYFYKFFYGKDLTNKEAVEIALDDKRSAELVKKVLFEHKNKAGHDWFNCNKKWNLDARIDLIKSLEE